jgi:uncharacterized protein (UPF0276 family)
MNLSAQSDVLPGTGGDALRVTRGGARGECRSVAPNPLPAQAGIGLRAPHHLEVLRRPGTASWFEAHTENYFADGGAHVDALTRIRADHPLSLHGVGLSLGSSDALSVAHLARIRRAVSRFEPALLSEHLSWSSVDGRFANDLLPLPYTEEALRHVSNRIAQVQDFLGKQILIENVSSYLQYECSHLAEWEFLGGVAGESGCGILLDLNNIYVAAQNHGFDARGYIDAIHAIVPEAVQEFHLAGHSRVQIDGRDLLIDTHSAPVCDAVWDLYRFALDRFGARPTLIEWDTDIPALDVLVAEAAKADRLRTDRQQHTSQLPADAHAQLA